MKTWRNFWTANLLAVAPLLCLVFGWIPDRVRLELSVKPQNPKQMPELVADGVVLQGVEGAGADGGSVWKFYLKEGMQWSDLIYRLPEGMDGHCVKRIGLEKWKLLALVKPGADLQKAESVWNDWAFRDSGSGTPGFAQGKIGWGLALTELLLLGLSWLAARHHRPEDWKTLFPSVLGVSFAWALLMQVALPVQSYVANRSSFPFAPWDLGMAVAVRFLLAWAASAACLGGLSRLFGRWVLSLVLAFMACVYLESGILSEGLPPLKGDLMLYTDRVRGLKDAAVWGGVFAAVAGMHRWLKPWLGVAGLCMALMSLAAMLDARPEKKADTSDLIAHDFVPVETVLRSVGYSSNRNVMVFIVDSLEREQAHAIMEDPEAGPGLREQFRGFTEYTNNVGACEYSLTSVANLMTGKYPASMMDPDFCASVYSDASVLKEYLDAGWAVYVGTETLGYGYTNRKREPTEAVRTDTSIWTLHSSGNSIWGLTAFCRFRWLPFIAKEPYAVMFSSGRPLIRDVAAREETAYPILEAGDVHPDERGVFLLFHTEGVHFPLLFNRHGERLPIADNTDEGIVESGIHVLGQLGRLLDNYRERGILDGTLVIVLADHGRHEEEWISRDGADARFTGNGRPFLWIKPPRCNHPFAASGAPTSHANMASVLKEAVGRDLDDDGIRTLLSSEDRVYRREKDSCWYDFHVAPDNSWRFEVVSPYERGNSEMRPIPLGQLIPLKFGLAEMRERGDIRFKGFPPRPNGGFFLDWEPIWPPRRKEVALAFKVASREQTYRVRLVGRVWRYEETAPSVPARCVRFSVRGNDAAPVTACSEGLLEVILEGAKPDGEGMIEIVGEREDGCDWHLAFTQLEVTGIP